MKFAVVAHFSRRVQAKKLAEYLGAELFMDMEHHGSTWNHRRALEWAATQNDRVVIIEDDAIPVDNFLHKLKLWFIRYPEHLISFYLGTSRPPQYQPVVSELIRQADISGNDQIFLRRLIHGVCYSIPKKDIPGVLRAMNMDAAADFSIGDAWILVSGLDVCYTVYSLTEHEDGERCELNRDGVIDRKVRKARRLNGTPQW